MLQLPGDTATPAGYQSIPVSSIAASPHPGIPRSRERPPAELPFDRNCFLCSLWNADINVMHLCLNSVDALLLLTQKK